MFQDLYVRNSMYGWIPDLPDIRDFSYQRIVPHIETLPASVDWRSRCSPIEDQGPIGSCTAHALVGNLEYLKQSRMDFSRLFVYYNERAIRKQEHTDSGASLRDGIKTLVQAGDCHESTWPYIPSLFADKPSDAAYTQALDYQITGYYRLHSMQEMKHTLASGYPFVFGFAAYESFESKQVAASGIVPMPQAGERMIGGHAVMAVGYDDASSMFCVRNSWGKEWGQQGYFFMPYQYLSLSSLTADFWTIRTME